MSFFDFLSGPSWYEKEQAKKKKSVFDSFSSAEDYAEEHREDHDGWEDAIDVWEAGHKKDKRKR